ncbi:MAG: hypothetical protein WD055_04260 [Candidatus Dependentiae bacterium]
MQKRFYLPLIYLLSPLSIQPFGSIHWMQEAMREMEEGFIHMQKAMDQAFTKNKPSLSGRMPQLTSQNKKNGVSLTFSGIESGDINAHINDNVITIDHADFKARITQSKSRYARSILLVETSAEEHRDEEKDDQSFSKAFYSSSNQTIPLEHEIDLNSIEITYNESSKELLVQLSNKEGTQIPISIQKK